MNTLRAALVVMALMPVVARLGHADVPYAACVVEDQATTPVAIDGIPFVQSKFFAPAKEGDATTTSLHGIEAEALFVLGGVNSIDRANPDWGGGDSFQNLFIGDQAGTVTVNYRSGRVDRIPLIFGHTVWWREPYRMAAMPFAKSKAAMGLIDAALCLIGGERTDAEHLAWRLALRREPVESIVFTDNPAKQGYPIIQALTFDRVTAPDPLPAKAFVILPGAAISREGRKFFAAHTVDSTDPLPAARRKALMALARSVATYPSDISWKTLRKVPPAIHAGNFPGPKVRFSGTPMAELMTRIYYENSAEMIGRIDDEGMVHESRKGADYYRGFGGWAPDLGAFFDTSYTRLRALTLIGNMGLLDKCDSAIRFFDHWLMYFPRAFPAVQMAGKPVPGHATVIANRPHYYFDVLRGVGWSTQYTTRDFGNPENDGHGMLMLTRWRAWVKQGRPAAWVTAHWEALNEAAEYIPWCLDNPDLSFSRHGLLYNESEGGMKQASLFCDFPCYLGLLVYAEMAESIGQTNKAQRWRGQAARLFEAMEAYYPLTDANWGDIWNPQKMAAWMYQHTTLTPVLLGMDYYGYDAIHRLPKEWAERTRQSYRRQLTTNQPEWCAPAGIGYGQCYITQGALLLDQMADAEKMLEWMGRLCFSPRQPHPYRVPEGSTVATDGSVWRRWGDLGNLYQLGEVVYTLQVVLGIDDVDTACLRLMPRLPATWSGLEVCDWPVRIQSEGESVMAMLKLKISRSNSRQRLTVRLETDRPMDACKFRMGPFAEPVRQVTCKINGRPIETALEKIGDSQWCWVAIGGGKCYKIEAVCASP